MVFVEGVVDGPPGPREAWGSNDVSALDEQTGTIRWHYRSPNGQFASIGSLERGITGTYDGGVLSAGAGLQLNDRFPCERRQHPLANAHDRTRRNRTDRLQRKIPLGGHFRGMDSRSTRNRRRSSRTIHPGNPPPRHRPVIIGSYALFIAKTTP